MAQALLRTRNRTKRRLPTTRFPAIEKSISGVEMSNDQPDASRSFLPRDKPKSWVVTIICGLIGVLVAGPLAVIGNVLQIEGLALAGTWIFWGSWLTAAPVSLFYICRLSTGHYKDIENRDWGDQVW